MSSLQSFSNLSSLISILLIFPLLANAHSCSEGFFMEATRNHTRQSCSLKALGAEFAWNFDNKTRRLEIAFGARLDSETGWIAWGLNQQAPSMVGTRALIGLKLSNRTDDLRWDQYDINLFTKGGCGMSPSDDGGLDVRSFSFSHWSGIGYYVILASVILSKEYNSSSLNVVWNIGKGVNRGQPLMHPTALANLDSAETIDLHSGQVVSFKPHERRQLRTAHGVLNIIGWGILLPTGVMATRYFRVFPLQWPWWFVFHASCQILGYTLGSIGWIIGLWLGHKSTYFIFATHRTIAIFIFSFTTIQMMAMRLKPPSKDEYRTYWNMYHHLLGYALLVVISVNIFQGIKIYETDHSWTWSYVGVLGVLGAVALAFEVFTWIKFARIKLKAANASKPSSNIPSSAQVGAA